MSSRLSFLRPFKEIDHIVSSILHSKIFSSPCRQELYVPPLFFDIFFMPL